MIGESILSIELPDETLCSLELECNETVSHYDGDYREIGFTRSCIFQHLGNLVSSRHFKNNSHIERMREQGLLDGYERGTFKFSEYVSTQMRDFNDDHCFVEDTLEQWDYKRGNMKMTARIDTNLGQVKSAIRDGKVFTPGTPDWELRVEGPGGWIKTFSINTGEIHE